MASSFSLHSNDDVSSQTDSMKSKEKVMDNINKSFNYDEILDHLGHMGKYQLRSFLLLCFPMLFPGIIIMSYSFIGGVPKYRCSVDGCDQDNSTQFDPDWLNNTTPWDESTNYWSHCYIYNHTWNNIDECLQGDNQPITQEYVEKCNDWVYDTSVFSSTTFTDFDLNCDNDWLQPIPSIAFMVGMLLGALMIGTLADIIGRRWTYIIGSIFTACVVTGTAFSPDIITFSVLRLLQGLGCIGLFDICYVWGIESVGPKYRVLCGFIYQLLLTIGCIIIGGIAYFVRDWRTLQLIIGVPIFVTILIFWFVPESILWLISEKRYKEAQFLILTAAKLNEKTIPPGLLVQIVNEVKITESGEIENSSTVEQTKENLVDVFRSPVMLKRLLFTSIIWFAVNMGYYGITFSANNLAGDFYLNYQLVMLVEIPALIGGKFVVDRFGRRPSLISGLVSGGIACLVTGLVPSDPAYIQVTLSVIGKFFATAVFGIIYIYTVELFPTSVRSAALGFCSTSSRIGGILAPIIADAGRTVNQALPYIIFAFVYTLVGLVALLLPETSGTPLPTTIAEAVDLHKSSKSCFSRFSKKSLPESSKTSWQQ